MSRIFKYNYTLRVTSVIILLIFSCFISTDAFATVKSANGSHLKFTQSKSNTGSSSKIPATLEEFNEEDLKENEKSDSNHNKFISFFTEITCAIGLSSLFFLNNFESYSTFTNSNSFSKKPFFLLFSSIRI